jgi:hypothetical protein
MVRSPFMEKMFGPVLYEAFRTIKRTFDPHGILNPGKIVDAPPLTANLRFGAATSPDARRLFRLCGVRRHGRRGGDVQRLGACRKTLEGTMCPSYMATRDESTLTRGRANTLRLAMAGRLGEAGSATTASTRSLDLCLECRACKAECPVGVTWRASRASSWPTTGAGTARRSRRVSWATRARWPDGAAGSRPLQLGAAERARSRAQRARARDRSARAVPEFTTGRSPRVRRTRCGRRSRALRGHLHHLLRAGERRGRARRAGGRGAPAGLARHGCCGRPQISKGLLADARELAARNAAALAPYAERGHRSCSSSRAASPRCARTRRAAQRRRAGARRGGGARQRAVRGVRRPSCQHARAPGRVRPPSCSTAIAIRRSMGQLAPAKVLLARIPGATSSISTPAAAAWAGSFGYDRKALRVSIGEANRRDGVSPRSRRPAEQLGGAWPAGTLLSRHQGPRVRPASSARFTPPVRLHRDRLPRQPKPRPYRQRANSLMSLAWLSLVALVPPSIVSCTRS